MLPKTLAKLRAGQKLRIVAFGDSITAGEDGSSLVALPADPFAIGFSCWGLIDGLRLVAAVATGTIAGTGGLVKLGSGTLALSANNTNSGSTSLQAGVVIVSHAAGLGAALRVPDRQVADSQRLKLAAIAPHHVDELRGIAIWSGGTSEFWFFVSPGDASIGSITHTCSACARPTCSPAVS